MAEVTNEALIRRDDESELQYHKRLVYGKLADKTLADVDYTELAEYVYGQPYASDVVRRMMYGSKRTLELMDRERRDGITEPALVSELDAKVLELRKEQQKFYDQRREYNKLVMNEGRREHLYESLLAAAENLDKTVGPLALGESPVRLSGSEAVLVFSDWHYGMKADNVFNTYDMEVCRERVCRVTDEAIARIKLHRCDVVHVVVLGDLFHGAIHTSARVASEELVCDQIMQVSEILAQSIQALSEEVSEVYVYMTYGNHGRTVANKNDSIHRDNMERIIPWWLRQRLQANERVCVEDEFDNEFMFIEAAGHEICASHGDLDSVKTSPRLLTGLFSKRYGKNIEAILLGDKHHRESFEELGVTAMICGSLCGADDYANDKRLYSTPSQLLLIVSPDVGIDAEYRLKCE